jgi:hypothetical protein
MKLKFSLQTFEKYSGIKFQKIGPIGAEWFNADRRTDVKEVIVAFTDFTNAPKG